MGTLASNPAGAVGDAAGAPVESPQASSANITTAVPRDANTDFHPDALKSTPSRCKVMYLPCGSGSPAPGDSASPCGQEDLQDLPVAFVDRAFHGGVAVGVGDVDVGTGLSQNSHHFAIAL